MKDKAYISEFGTNGKKALNFQKTFECRDPNVLERYTAGQWFKPCWGENESVPAFQFETVLRFEPTISRHPVAHAKRKGLHFAFSFMSPLYLLTDPHAEPVELPRFQRAITAEIWTPEENKQAIKLFDTLCRHLNCVYQLKANGAKKELVTLAMDLYNTTSYKYTKMLNTGKISIF